MDVKGMRVYENGMSGIPHQNSMIPGTGERQTGFDELLQEKAKVGLNFSKHAAKRLGERGISVDNHERLRTRCGGRQKKGGQRCGHYRSSGSVHCQCSQQYGSDNHGTAGYEGTSFHKY